MCPNFAQVSQTIFLRVGIYHVLNIWNLTEGRSKPAFSTFLEKLFWDQ